MAEKDIVMDDGSAAAGPTATSAAGSADTAAAASDPASSGPAASGPAAAAPGPDSTPAGTATCHAASDVYRRSRAGERIQNVRFIQFLRRLSNAHYYWGPRRRGSKRGNRGTEAHRMLVEVYGDTAPTDKSCREWFQRFKNGDFSVEDKPRSGQPKKFEDKELEALLEEDQSQKQEKLAESLGLTQQDVSEYD
ncbi:PREDICTED: uncharacterized protein LOC108779803 [Cyphomyrmex costatus]|uniref:uncharacterized protein LOC108779803 n=1 Tax=Cyphomyrmex costatus TaxID=456900 RepID=UPI0008523FFB|nr:PREDICTED: uncharacterized protein LOC108779803 [Cyphomyrmex costatus]